MSWGSNGSVQSKRNRLELLARRTEETELPPVEAIFARSNALEKPFALDIIDKVYFSEFPGAKEGGAAAIRGFLTNTKNTQALKDTGTVGALLEMFYRMDISAEYDSPHGQNLIPTLYKLCIGDKNVQGRMLANSRTLPILLELITVTSGEIQLMCFEILNEISSLPGALKALVKLDVLVLLFSRELMYRPSTLVEVKHGAVAIVNRITNMNPSLFPVPLFEEAMLDVTGTRRVDGHTETHLLSSFLVHVNDLKRQNKTLATEFKLFRHLVSEILQETFEDLDHMQQILKCILLLMDDHKQALHLIDCELIVALQLMVRTDYHLLRRNTGASAIATSGSLKSTASTTTKGKKAKKLDDRPLPTRMALALVKPQQTAKAKSDDINYVIARTTLLIYQEVIVHKPECISQLVSSGLVPALLHRIGTGPEKDWRFNKLVNHFMYLMLMKVAEAQSDKDDMIPLVDFNGKLPFYATLGFEMDESRAAQKLVESLRAKVNSYKDIRLISNTLAAHGMASFFVGSIFRHEDTALIVEALRSLALLKFSCIQEFVFDVHVIARLVTLTQRHDCFYCGLAILLDSALYPDLEEKTLDDLMKAGALSVFIRACSLSGWIFKMKARVYKAIAVMSQHPDFMAQLRIDGLAIVVDMINIKKRQAKANRRDRDNNEDDSTESLLRIMRADWAMSRIQSVCRSKITRLIMSRSGGGRPGAIAIREWNEEILISTMKRG